MTDSFATLASGRREFSLPRTSFALEVVKPPGESAALPAAALGQAFDRPIGIERLSDPLRGAGSALVVVCDGTRSTGSARFLPVLLERLDAAGIDDVAFAVAGGLHRPPTEAEIRKIFGATLAARHPILLHDADDGTNLIEFGRTAAGTPVRAHRALREFDRLVLTGAVGFHYYAGFSGGRKSVVPGLAARETIVGNHMRALRDDGTREPRACAGRLDDNPVHLDMEQGAALIGPHLVVNSVLTPAGELERLFVGDWRRAHREGCRYLARQRAVRLAPRKLVIASAGGHPWDLNVIQAHKAYEAAFAALSPGGVFVLVASCAEGAGHADFTAGIERGGEREMVRALRKRFRVYAQTALSWQRKTQSCRLVLVSDLAPDAVRALGATPATDLEQAIALARQWLPADSTGWVWPHGSKLLVQSEPDSSAGAGAT